MAHIPKMDQQALIVQNIVRFERMIAQEGDAKRRELLRDQLAEEQDKLFVFNRRNAPG